MLSNRKYLFAGIGGALVMLAIMIGAFFAGPLFAFAASGQSTPTPTAQKNNYCTLFEQDLAKELGTTVEKLRAARQSASTDVIDQMVKDGKLTQEKANKIKERIAKKPARDCNFRDKHHNHNADHVILHKYASDMLTGIASGLKLTPDALKAQLKTGKSLNDIAKAQNVSETDLKNLVNTTISDTLKKAVNAKEITQERADAITKFINNHPKFIERILNKDFAKKQA